MKLRQLAAVLLAAIVAFAAVGCDKEPDTKPVNKPTIGIAEPEFDATTMKVKVMIAPSTDAEAWYWRVEGGSDTLDETFTKVEGAAAKEIEFVATYGVEYTIKAYAENKAGKSDIAEKRFCAMPEGEVALTIGEIALNDNNEVEVTIYPSKATTAWYWRAYDKESEESDYTKVEGNSEQTLTLPYEWNATYKLEAYATCGEIEGEKVEKEYCFELAVPTISESKPMFDEESMSVTFEVVPSQDTHHWSWRVNDGDWTIVEGAEANSISYDVEYDVAYTFEFVAANIADDSEEPVKVEFKAVGPMADIAIENLTAFTLDANITKHDNCVKYVVGAVHTSAYDRKDFVEQAQSSLNPDPDYPFAAFNSATESRTFTEQDLVRNSRTDSSENAGLILIPGTSYTIAVYGEDESGNYNVSTKEFVVPVAEINGSVELSIKMGTITETSAEATLTASEQCKVIFGYVDPAITVADTENPFDFEGKSDEEIKQYLVSMPQSVPTIYNEPISRLLSNRLEIDHKYYAYAIAIKDGKIGDVAFTSFNTVRPTLSGTAKIVSAVIEEQTTHDTLCVKLTVEGNSERVRLYAAPSNDHAAYADNLEYILDAKGYQNYREEYAVVDGVTTANISIYHPGDRYYLYASAVDNEGNAGAMVCVARLAGFDTDYYTTIEEIIDEGNLSYDGTGSATMSVEVLSDNDDRISVALKATNFSSNVAKVWFFRVSGLKSNIESLVKSNLVEYPERVLGSYKEVIEGNEYRYEDSGSAFNPKFESLLKYDNSWGGDIIVMTILDTAGKVKIHSYYAAGAGISVL
ncbi:MAG: hypothetical protein J6U49_04225 [Alistipes sp.]|nr:hypothetical protein [Alistipes sp.]